MEFGCSVCEYPSKKKENVVRHIKKRNNCGSGVKEVIEIPIQIICEFCNKNFSTSSSLSKHQKNNCIKKIKILEEKIKLLEEKNKELEKRPSNITNITNNNIIIVNNYENTSLEKLTDKDYFNIIRNAEAPYKMIPDFIKHVHFNDEIPENNNICLPNRNENNKYLQILRDGYLEIVDKNSEIDNLISDKENNLQDWVNEKGEKYPKALKLFNEYIETKNDEDIKLTREEVKFLLYNYRRMVKKA